MRDRWVGFVDSVRKAETDLVTDCMSRKVGDFAFCERLQGLGERPWV